MNVPSISSNVQDFETEVMKFQRNSTYSKFSPIQRFLKLIQSLKDRIRGNIVESDVFSSNKNDVCQFLISYQKLGTALETEFWGKKVKLFPSCYAMISTTTLLSKVF